MEENHIHIYLKLNEFELHPDDLTKILGINPTKTGVIGGRFFIGNKKKKIEREYQSNFWEYKEPHITDTKWQQEYVNDFINRIIKPRVEVLKRITSEGSGELALAPYYYNEWNLGFDFDLEVLKVLVDCGLILDIDIYCFEND